MKCARLNSTFIIFWVVKMEFKNSHYDSWQAQNAMYFVQNAHILVGKIVKIA